MSEAVAFVIVEQDCQEKSPFLRAFTSWQLALAYLERWATNFGGHAQALFDPEDEASQQQAGIWEVIVHLPESQRHYIIEFSPVLDAVPEDDFAVPTAV